MAVPHPVCFALDTAVLCAFMADLCSFEATSLAACA